MFVLILRVQLNKPVSEHILPNVGVCINQKLGPQQLTHQCLGSALCPLHITWRGTACLNLIKTDVTCVT